MLVHYDVLTSRVSFWTVLTLYALAMWFCTGCGCVLVHYEVWMLRVSFWTVLAL